MASEPITIEFDSNNHVYLLPFEKFEYSLNKIIISFMGVQTKSKVLLIYEPIRTYINLNSELPRRITSTVIEILQPIN